MKTHCRTAIVIELQFKYSYYLLDLRHLLFQNLDFSLPHWQECPPKVTAIPKYLSFHHYDTNCAAEMLELDPLWGGGLSSLVQFSFPLADRSNFCNYRWCGKIFNFDHLCLSKWWWCKGGARWTINNHKIAPRLMWLMQWYKCKGVENLQGFTRPYWSNNMWKLV